MGAYTVAFTGEKGGAMAKIADAVAADSLRMTTPRIQEGHILCGHMLCDCVEQAVCSAARKQEARIAAPVIRAIALHQTSL